MQDFVHNIHKGIKHQMGGESQVQHGSTFFLIQFFQNI